MVVGKARAAGPRPEPAVVELVVAAPWAARQWAEVLSAELAVAPGAP